MSVAPLRTNWVLPSPDMAWLQAGVQGIWSLAGCILIGGCSPSSSMPPTPAATHSAATKSLDNQPEQALGSRFPVSPHYQFTSVLAESQIDFQHESGDSLTKAFPAANGSGIGVFDLDRDGQRDLLFLTNNQFEPDQSRHANRCYRNLGSFRFADVTSQCGLGHVGHSAGVAAGDINNDGFVDLYVTCYGENQLYVNCGDGTFENVSRSSGTADKRWGTSAAFLDIEGDGLLDLYVGNYARWTPEESAFCGDHKRQIRMYCSPKSVVPENDILYRNQGDGSFADVSESSGILATTGRSQGVLTLDINDDSRTDIYVTNDLNPNSLWINQGQGHFENQANAVGVAYDQNGAAQAGMGVAAADANRDGRLDLFVTNFEGEYNAYYEQDASGFFNEVSQLRGLAAASLPWIGWGTVLTDFDLDGWPDVFVLNGHTDNNMHEMGREGNYAQPALLWRNERGQFTPVTPHDSPFFLQTHPGRGVACGDLDNDLDGDLICNQQDLLPDILRNDCPHSADRVVLQLELVGTEFNREAIGAMVYVESGELKVMEQVKSGGSYLCANDSRLTVVIPSADKGAVGQFQIRWGENSSTVVELPLVSGRAIIRGNRVYPLPHEGR
ncbi:MAG: VCBS repeat-containing protein [Planctomycetota bacterium]|nr:MAG: VCBS repeat-containing protein [Planctomycetota bacterium]